MKSTYKTWSERGVVTNYDEDIQKRIGNKRGCYGIHGGKTMSGTAAAIISTLHAAGPDLTLRAKDMVNDATRRGYAHDYGHMVQRQLPLRGQTSCGEDEFNGTLLRLYQVIVPDDMDDLLSRYGGWKITVDDDGEYVGFKEMRLTYEEDNSTYSTYDQANKLVREHIEAYVEELNGWAVTETDWSEKTLGETTTRDERLDWMLQRYTLDQWKNLLGYKMWKSNSNYKGECAWDEADIDGKCLHHNGTVYENVIQYTFDATYGKQEWHYLDEYVDDEADLLKLLVDDEDVLAHIKKQIPKMKTGSRQWIHAPTTRGHYALAWWSWIQREARSKLDYEARVAEVEQDKARDGFEINGWKFVVGTVSTRYGSRGDVTPSMWYPIEPVLNYKVGAFMFRSKTRAEDFAASINEQRHMMVGREMDKGGAVIGHLLNITEERVYLSLSRDVDPTLYTPEEIASICYTNGTFPEGYPFNSTYLCTFADEEE